VKPLFLLLVLLVAACGRPLEEGDYAFTVQQVVRDSCGLAGLPAVSSGASFKNSGRQVIFVLPVGTTPLYGWYRYGADTFYAEGTAPNLTLQAGGTSCFIEATRLALDGSVQGPTTFIGSLSLQGDPQQQPACACTLEYTFSAERTLTP
jgi:hypothetical protein